MRVFLAGASGVIGRRLVPLLVAAGHQVTGTAPTPAGEQLLRARGATPTRVDVFDPDALLRAVDVAAPDVVVHQLTALAGGSLAENARIRRDGTRHLVRAAKAAGVTRIVAQSISWVYAPGDEPAAEDVPLDLTAPQPRAGTIDGVHALEAAVTELDEWVVLRYGMLYGPGTWYAPDGRIAAQVRAGELRATDAVTSFLHVDDAAAAAVRALSWPTGVVNIVDDEPASARQWLPVYAAALGAPAVAVDPGRAGWERGASNRTARDRLGWRPSHPSWRTGFAASVTDVPAHRRVPDHP